MEIAIPVVFLIALAACIYLMNKKPEVSENSLKSTEDLQGLQTLAKLFILIDDTITYVANNHAEYYAKKQITKRIKKFQRNHRKNYVYDGVANAESNTKITAACCDASGNFNPAYAGNLGVLFNKLKLILQVSLDDFYHDQTVILDQYVFVEKNFDELLLLIEILENPTYSYYLTNNNVDQLNSISHALDRLMSVYEGYEPDFDNLPSVEYGTSVFKEKHSEANMRQLQFLEQAALN